MLFFQQLLSTYLFSSGKNEKFECNKERNILSKHIQTHILGNVTNEIRRRGQLHKRRCGKHNTNSFLDDISRARLRLITFISIVRRATVAAVRFLHQGRQLNECWGPKASSFQFVGCSQPEDRNLPSILFSN